MGKKHIPAVIGLSEDGHHLHAPKTELSASAVRRHARAARMAALTPAAAKGNAIHAWMNKEREVERRLRQIERGILKIDEHGEYR